MRGDLPDETSVPNGYYLLTSVKEELLESGAGGKKSKGFFSSTTGVAGDLEKILKQYDRDDLSLVETAQFLVKSTDYEIPALSSKLERIYNQIGDTGEHPHSLPLSLSLSRGSHPRDRSPSQPPSSATHPSPSRRRESTLR